MHCFLNYQVALLWWGYFCNCFCLLCAGKITAVIALPGLISIEELHLKPTYRQQLCSKISMRSHFRLFSEGKKKHFQQSSTRDAIYSGHIEDRMLIFKGLNLSSISPSPTNRKKSPAPSYLRARDKIWKLGFVCYIKGFTESPHFAVVGRWDVLAHMCHLRLGDSEKELRSIASFQAVVLLLLLNLLHDPPQWKAKGVPWPRGSHGQGYVGAFTPCKSAVASTVYFHSHLPSMASFLHDPVPSGPAQAPMGWITHDLIEN